MAYDGSIIIDTQLNTSELESSLSKLCSTIESAFAKTGQSAGDALMKGITAAMSNTSGITSQISKIQSSFKTVGTAVDGGLSTPFQNALKTVTTSVTGITKQIKTIPTPLSSLSGAIIKGISTPFSTAASNVISKSASMADAISTIASGTDGIASKINKNVIQPMKNMDKSIKTSTDGSRKSIDLMGVALTGACSGYEAMATAANVLSTAQTIGKAITDGCQLAMGIYSAVTGTSSAVIGGATVAQNGLNVAMAANPIGLVVIAVMALIAAIVAVTAAIISLFDAFKKNNEEEEALKKRTEELTKETEELCNANKELNDSIKSGQKERRDSLASAEAEAVATEKLTDELYKLNDKQNKTNEDKEKMQGIVDKLNETLPDLALNFDKETGALSKNKDEVYKAIQAKKDLARQNAAVNMLTSAYEDQYKAEVSMNELLTKRKELQEQIAQVAEGSEQSKQLTEQLQNIETQITATGQAYKTACDEIDYSNKVMDASTSETSTKMQYNASQIAQNFKIASQDTAIASLSMKDQLIAFGDIMVGEGSKYGSEFISKWKSGLDTASPEALTSVETFIDYVLSTMDTEEATKILGNAAVVGFDGGIKTKAGTLDFSGTFSNPVKNATPAVIKSADSTGQQATTSFYNGANKQGPSLQLPFAGIVESSGNETVDLSLDNGKKVGFEFVEGIKQGVQEKTGEVTEAIKTMAQTVESNSNEAVKTIAKPLGGALVNGIELGAADQQGPLNSKIQQIVRNAIEAGRIEAGVNSPSKVTRDEIGKPLVQGVVKGIGLEQKNLNKSMGGLLNNMLKSGKNTMGIHSPSTVMRDEIGANIPKGVGVGIKENGKEMTEAFQTELDKLQAQRDLDIINEDEYYTELEKLRDAYFKEGTEEWVQYTTEIYDYQQKLQEEQKKNIIDTYQTMVDEADKAISELEKKQENFEKKLQQNDYFFVTHTLKDIDGNEVGKLGELRDFSDEIEKINQYNDAIDKAQARLGGSAQGQAVYEALLDMDMEQGKLFADTLINASDAELQEYLKSYQEYQNAIKQASREEFAGEWAELESQYGGMYQRLEQTIIDTFGEIPEEFLENGKLSAEQFGDGFLEKLTEVQSKLDSGAMGIKLADETALQQQRSDGQAAGEAFSQGLVQSEQAIQTAGSSLKDKLIEQFGSVPDDFFAIGQDSTVSIFKCQ